MKNADMPAMPVDFDQSMSARMSGLTKREYFAAMAMQGLVSSSARGTSESFAKNSVVLADALLAELEKTTMSNYPYCGEPPLDPPDDAENEIACEAAWREYLDNGSLPDGRDAGDVDELLSELGILDDLLLARSDDDLLDAAKAIRDARQTIVDGIIRGSVSI